MCITYDAYYITLLIYLHTFQKSLGLLLSKVPISTSKPSSSHLIFASCLSALSHSQSRPCLRLSTQCLTFTDTLHLHSIHDSSLSNSHRLSSQLFTHTAYHSTCIDLSAHISQSQLAPLPPRIHLSSLSLSAWILYNGLHSSFTFFIITIFHILVIPQIFSFFSSILVNFVSCFPTNVNNLRYNRGQCGSQLLNFFILKK